MKPVLWTFRRCPYAIRARLAIASSGVDVEQREILLRDKPTAFLAASPAGTVPVVEGAGQELVHSLDIMKWALRANDPEQLLQQPELGNELIVRADGDFKATLDRYKYHVRIEGADPAIERMRAMPYLQDLSAQIADQDWLFGPKPKLADLAILPFIRQFAHVDLEWFMSAAPPNIVRWLENFKSSDRFLAVMSKNEPWQSPAAAQTN